MKQVIIEKSRGTRILKSRKDLLIHWEKFEEKGILAFGKINEE